MNFQKDESSSFLKRGNVYRKKNGSLVNRWHAHMQIWIYESEFYIDVFEEIKTSLLIMT